MLKITVFFGMLFLFFGCAGNNDGELKGDFIYIADAAVLKGDDFIYGIEVDSILMELAKKAEPFKKNSFDMVPIIVEGDLHQKEKNTEGWDTIIKLTKIIKVGPAKKNQEDKKE